MMKVIVDRVRTLASRVAGALAKRVGVTMPGDIIENSLERFSVKVSYAKH